MKTVQVVAYEIPSQPTLDAITVYFQDFEPGKGRVVLECWGSAWSCYFGGMSRETIREFFTTCGTDYLVNKLGNTQYLKKSNEAYLKRIIQATQKALREASE